MADLTTGNINSEAQTAASINDGDYIYIYKADAGVFSKIEKSLLLQGAGGGSGSGISAEVYEAIKDNVNRVQGRLDALIGALANMAFNSLPKPALVGELTWPDGTTPSTQTASLVLKFNGTTVNGSTVNVTADDEDDTTIWISVKAKNLTSGDSFTMSLSNASGYTLSQSTITASEATIGADVAITYSGTSASNTRLTISGNGLSASVMISIAEAGAEVTYYDITGVLTGCTINGLSSVSAQVASGGNWSGTLVAEEGYTLPEINNYIITSGTFGSISLSGSTLTISGITSDITFAIVATQDQQEVTEYETDGLVLHLDGQNQGAESGVWKDTVGNKRFVLEGNPVVTENGVMFSTGENGVANNYGYYENENNVTIDWPCSSYTIEVCFTTTDDFDSANKSQSFFGSSKEGDIAATFKCKTNSGFGFGAFSYNTSKEHSYKRLLQSGETLTSGSYYTLSMNVSRQMLNGVVNMTNRVNTAVGTVSRSDTRLMVGGIIRTGISPNALGCDAIIHEVRIYDHELSPEEMKKNQRVDNQRYFGSALSI